MPVNGSAPVPATKVETPRERQRANCARTSSTVPTNRPAFHSSRDFSATPGRVEAWRRRYRCSRSRSVLADQREQGQRTLHRGGVAADAFAGPIQREGSVSIGLRRPDPRCIPRVGLGRHHVKESIALPAGQPGEVPTGQKVEEVGHLLESHPWSSEFHPGGDIFGLVPPGSDAGDESVPTESTKGVELAHQEFGRTELRAQHKRPQCDRGRRSGQRAERDERIESEVGPRRRPVLRHVEKEVIGEPQRGETEALGRGRVVDHPRPSFGLDVVVLG